MSKLELQDVAGDLVTLDDASSYWDAGVPLDLRPIRSSILEGAPDPVPEAVALRLASFIATYPAFDPPLDTEQRSELLTDLLYRTESDRVVYEVALAVESLGPAAVRSLVRAMAADARHVDLRDRLDALVSYLLDNDRSRATVVEELAAWHDDGSLHAIATNAARVLDDDERRIARLGESS